MSLLDEMRAEIGAAFEDTSLFFIEAVLTRADGSGGWEEERPAVETHPCKAMLGTYTDHLRAVAGIPDTDAKLLIVGTSIAVDPLKGDTVTLAGRSWAMIAVKTDPARAMWTCQVRPV